MNNNRRPMPVDEEEMLTRFIFYSKWYRSSDGSIKPLAFMPKPETNDTSVFRHSGFTDPDSDLSRIGEEGARKRCCNYHGRADIKAEYVYQQGLGIEPTETPEHHANIVGWPQDKNKRLIIATQLAANSVSCLKNL